MTCLIDGDPGDHDRISTAIGLDHAVRCVQCAKSGPTCLNRNIRIINFAVDCAAEAERRGSPMTVRAARTLFNLVRVCRDWKPEHFSVIEALCYTIRDIGETERTAAPADGLDAWMDWLERIAMQLAATPSGFPCSREFHAVVRPTLGARRTAFGAG